MPWHHRHTRRLWRSVAQVEGDLLLGDMGQGLPVRQGVFDGAISISALQWLCNADKAAHDPRKRLKAFFESLYRGLSRGARAVLQVRRPLASAWGSWRGATHNVSEHAVSAASGRSSRAAVMCACNESI